MAHNGLPRSTILYLLDRSTVVPSFVRRLLSIHDSI